MSEEKVTVVGVKKIPLSSHLKCCKYIGKNRGVICVIMPISWRYMDVYEVIIHYITNHLDPTNYVLKFSIIALHETRPKVIIRFTLKNTRNNRKESWTQLLEGETLEDLFDSMYETVETTKLEV